MSGLRYTVSIQDAGFIGEWLELAAFRWFTDARHHAQRSSKADSLERFVRVQSKGGAPDYFCHGQYADHLYGEDIAA